MRGPDPYGGRASRTLPAADLYGRLLATAAAAVLSGAGTPQARIRLADGRLEALPLDLWLGPVTPADRMVVDFAEGPVLDVGCGPGRLLEALEAAGKRALGVDLSPQAVGMARSRGARAIAGCVFGDLPGGATWRTILLLDGNIGIGGNPEQLLRRVAGLLRPDGIAIVEVGPSGSVTRRTRVRLEGPGVVSDWFGWAEVSADGIGALAAAAGLQDAGRCEHDGRVFAMLQRTR